mgnify:CR=1 FL=1
MINMPYCEECGNWIEKGTLCENCKYLKGLTEKHAKPCRLAYPFPKVNEKFLISFLRSKLRMRDQYGKNKGRS